MITWRRKDFNAPPIELINENRLAALGLAIILKDGDEVQGAHYNFELTTNLLKAYSLDKDTFDENTDLAKCYYCESTSEVVASLQVEHYRPKKRMDDENRREIPDTHGYYWLGIEWSNLVLACSKCNGRGAKGNIFTVQGKRIKNGTSFTRAGRYNRATCIADQSPLIDEKPDLLHPEIDDAFQYLKFDREGRISHKLPRGERTIKICRLDRKQLNIARNDLINVFNDSFWEVVGWHKDGIITGEQVMPIFWTKCIALRDRLKRNEPYTLLVRYMIDCFDDFFVTRVPPEYQEDLAIAFILSDI